MPTLPSGIMLLGYFHWIFLPLAIIVLYWVIRYFHKCSTLLIYWYKFSPQINWIRTHFPQYRKHLEIPFYSILAITFICSSILIILWYGLYIPKSNSANQTLVDKTFDTSFLIIVIGSLSYCIFTAYGTVFFYLCQKEICVKHCPNLISEKNKQYHINNSIATVISLIISWLIVSSIVYFGFSLSIFPYGEWEVLDNFTDNTLLLVLIWIPFIILGYFLYTFIIYFLTEK